ncbi:hypothetical protein BDY21DRAFT_6485 [Lineolata rhizophorae]|uniref:Uncharacterized protein n=1 Tax=Lineolata rhizophorae TaxID=578093 RepID=A0A6A6PE78_9PEZI|nr:hypothetical protein BDY21DRAFT_6485 [Lineolata rhizophorae]
MPPKPTGSHGALPSDLDIALAVAIVNSKPVDISLEDFLDRLRNSIRPSQKQERQRSERLYIDMVTYWKKRFEQANTARAELEVEVAGLRREKRQLPMTASTEEGRNNIPIHEQLKRKKIAGLQRVERSAIDATESPSSTTPLAVELDEDDVRGSDNVLESSTSTTGVAEAVYTLHNLNTPGSADTNALSRSLIQLCSSLMSIATWLHSRSTPVPTRRKSISALPDFPSTIRGIARGISSYLYHLVQISRADTSNEATPDTIIAGIHLLKHLLQCLSPPEPSDTGSDATGRPPAPSTSPRGREKGTKPRTSQARCDPTAPPSSPTEPTPFARALTSLLLATLSQLTPAYPAHAALFDAFMRALLHRVGALVSVFALNAWPEGDTERALREPRRPKEEEMARLRAEAVCLRDVLERSVVVAAEMGRAGAGEAEQRMGGKAGKSNGARGKRGIGGGGGGKLMLLSSTRERLQRVLVRGIFGDGTGSVPEWARLPREIVSQQKLVKVDEENVPRWFQGEVWRLVGWDVLREEGDWDGE